MAKVKKETVTLRRSNSLLGDKGDKVEVFDWEKRQLIASGYVEGDDIETVPPSLVEVYKEAAKGPEERGDMDVFSVDKAAEEGDGYGSADEGVGHEQNQAQDSKPSKK